MDWPKLPAPIRLSKNRNVVAVVIVVVVVAVVAITGTMS